MATTRLMPLHIGKGRTVGTAIQAIIDYVENPEKTDYGNLIASWQCDSRAAIYSLELAPALTISARPIFRTPFSCAGRDQMALK